MLLNHLRYPLLGFAVACGLASSATAAVVINEILYRPAGVPEDPKAEFIEILNTSAATVDLGGWKLDKGVSFTFAAGATLAPNGLLVIVADPPTFATKYPTVQNYTGPWTGALSNTGEEIRLVDALGVTQDSVQYASGGDWAQRVREAQFGGWDWSSPADSAGNSLEKRNPALTVDSGQNWRSSAAVGGTPGTVNSRASTDVPPIVTKVKHAPASPRSTDPITISCELTDELPAARLAATLFWRNATSTVPGPWASVPMPAKASGKYSAVLAPLPDKTIIEFYISASDGTQTRTWPAPTSEGQNANCLCQVDNENYTGTDEIYRLIVTPADNTAFTTINSQSDREFNTTLVTVRNAQTSIRYQSGFRIRGASSRDYTFRPMRVSVPSDNLLDGVRVFNLNPKWPWNQYLGLKLVQAAGLRAEDARPVEVRRNGMEFTVGGNSARDYGRWVRVEHLDGDFVDSHWPLDNAGNLYKKVRPDNNWAFRNGNVNQYLGDGWSKESNSAANDWSDLDGLMGAVNAVLDAHKNDMGAWDGTGATNEELAQVSAHADLDQWARWMAIENFMGNSETNASNGADDDYSLYRGAVSGKFEFVPHDHDTLFGLGEGARATNANFFDMTSDADILEPLQPLFGNATTPGNLVLREKYYAALRDLANTVFAEPGFSAFVDNHIGTWVPAAERTQIKSYIAARRTAALAAIAADTSVTLPPYVAPAPTSIGTLASIPGDLRINEVLAHNVSALASGASFPDAIELFNGGTTALDLGGMTLTDDVALPAKYALPAGTTLAAGGYLTIFATEELGAGLRTGFGLNQEGDELRLYTSDGVLVDAVKFGPQAPDLSIGRTGANRDTWALVVPTIGAANGAPVALGSVAGVRINELFSNPDYLFDDDFVELYNPAAQPVALGNVAITDDFINRPTRQVLPPLSFIGAHDFLVLRPVGDSASASNASELTFKFSSGGTWAALIGANGATIDQADTDTMPPDVSRGRTPDGTSTVASFGLPTNIPTPGAPNVAPPAGILALLNHLRISEILYKPNELEFVELQNTGTTALDLAGVRFVRGLTYTFPTGTTLAPGALLVVCKSRVAFQAQYGASIPLAPGEFSGTLDNAGETIALQPPAPWNVNILRFRYETTWYPETDNNFTLTVDDVYGTAARDWDEKETWIPSAAAFGTPGVALPPVIQAPHTATAILHDGFSFPIVTKRNVTTYGSSPLPAGLTLNAATGVISGSPAVTGHFSITLTATNPAGSDSSPLDLTISDTGPFVGFVWSGTGSAQYVNVPFNVTLRAVDAQGRTVTSMNGAAQLSAKSISYQNPVVFTEANTTSPDYFELQNISPNAVDTTNWFVVANQSGGGVNAAMTMTWTLPSALAVGQITGASDEAVAANRPAGEAYFGENIDWPNSAAGPPGWVMLVDNAGVVRDFVSWGYSEAQLATINLTRNNFPLTVGSQWLGASAPTVPQNQSLLRTGNQDTDSAADWVLSATGSRYAANSQLTLPFLAQTSPLASNLPASVELVNGQWSGKCTITAVAGAADLEAEITGQPLLHSSIFSVTVPTNNTPPAFTKGADEIVVEDSGAHTVANWATDISPGAEPTQVVNFLVTNDNASLFSTPPAITPTGTLTYTPAPNANGISVVTVRLHDNGGTADGGVDTSAAQTFSITVLPVNDPPTISLGQPISVFQNAGLQTIQFASNIGPGPEAGQSVQIQVTNDKPEFFSVQPTISGTGSLRFSPTLNAGGVVTVTVRLQDNGGTDNGGSDVTVRTFTITIQVINDPPSFVAGPALAVPGGTAYAQPWATQISPGGPGEETQTMLFSVVANPTKLFTEQPSIDPSGVLRFTAGKKSGAATVRVVLKDSGGTAAGGVDTGQAVNFTIEITAPGNAAGHYRTLVTPTAGQPANFAGTGLLEVTVSASGSFTAKLKRGGTAVSLHGTLGVDGVARFGKFKETSVLLGKNTTERLGFTIDLANPKHPLNGWIGTDPTQATPPVAQFSGERDAYSAKVKVPNALRNLQLEKGNYTALFTAQAAPNETVEADEYPPGDGWSVVKVSPTGAVTMRGQLADGTRFTYASALDSQNRFPLYLSLYKAKGAVWGPLAFQTPVAPAMTTLASAGLKWFRPQQLLPKPAPQYTAGWPDGIDLGFTGAGRNSVPEPNVLPAGPYTLTLTDGGLPAPSPQDFTVLAKNRVTLVPDTRKVTVKIKPTGEWTGSFIHPGTGKKTTVQGVNVRGQETTGFFLAPTTAGRAVIAPKTP